ncbi:hypothetical protein ACIRPT_40400 [Streptomyces sp. NPDC101227]
MLAAARDSFTDGFQTAASVSAGLFFAAALTVWFMLRGQKLEDSAPECP